MDDVDQLIAQLYGFDSLEPATFAEDAGASTERLMDYWAHGEGAAKIGWEAPCAFCRCLDHLRKYFPGDAPGLCNHLEQRATGHPPNPEHSRKKHCPC